LLGANIVEPGWGGKPDPARPGPSRSDPAQCRAPPGFARAAARPGGQSEPDSPPQHAFAPARV